MSTIASGAGMDCPDLQALHRMTPAQVSIAPDILRAHLQIELIDGLLRNGLHLLGCIASANRLPSRKSLLCPLNRFSSSWTR